MMFKPVELKGFPLHDAMENPEVIEWMKIVPWLKDAFIDGRIQGIILMDRVRVINVDRSMLETDIAIIKSKLGVFVGVMD
jgi:hypothetical protein